jgi:small basic protein (TIGR04137 family)
LKESPAIFILCVHQFTWKGSHFMTIDRSLRVRSGSIANRNVLTRGERLQKLKEAEKWQDGGSVFGLPKVRVIKLALKKKKKAKAEEAAEGAAGAAAPAAGATPAAGAKPAAAAKSAGGAKGGKK